MSEVKWIKITTNIFDDEKIRLIETLPESDMLIVIWFKLLILAGKNNDGGLVYLTRDIPYNVEMLATILRRPAATVRLAIGEFKKLGMIEFFDDFLQIVNWEKHQNLHQLEMAKEQTRLRVEKHRKNQKALCNVTVTKCNGDRLDKIRLDKNRIDNIIPEKEESFNIFWNIYDKKVNSKECKRLWYKIDQSLYQCIFNHSREYVKSKPDKQYRKDPERYLKNELWTSEIITNEKVKPAIPDNLKRFQEMEKTL